jgi:hypothetical protein
MSDSYLLGANTRLQIISMATCLASAGLQRFQFQETKIGHEFIVPWALYVFISMYLLSLTLASCASKAILQGSCLDGIGIAVKSEPGQMFEYHRTHNLAEPQDCTEYSCGIPNDYSECADWGCGKCDQQMFVCRDY